MLKKFFEGYRLRRDSHDFIDRAIESESPRDYIEKHIMSPDLSRKVSDFQFRPECFFPRAGAFAYDLINAKRSGALKYRFAKSLISLISRRELDKLQIKFSRHNVDMQKMLNDKMAVFNLPYWSLMITEHNRITGEISERK